MAEQLCLFTNIERAEEFVRTVNELKELAQETRGYLRILCAPSYNKALSKVLPSKEERHAYEHSDGSRPSREVAGIAGISHVTAQHWWKEWVDKGMGEGIPVQGGGQRFKAKYTLLELAVAVLEGRIQISPE